MNIFFSRHGQSIYNLDNRVGGDSDISKLGQEYSKKLFNFFNLILKKEDVVIYTSNLKRTKSTAKYFIKNGYEVIHKDILNEINSGICSHYTYNEIKKNFQQFMKIVKKINFLLNILKENHIMI